MSTPILATKLYIPPPQPKAVSRPRLVERLDDGLHRKLTLISAPAGFGKSTLLSEWAALNENRVAWLSLDAGDNDLTRFLTHLIAALQTIAPQVGEGTLRALASPQPPPLESLLTLLLNDVSKTAESVVLILDDYHVIDSPSADSAIIFLLEHMPPQMHLVIATREDPQFPLARLRTRGQLIELRAADLRFTPDEAAEFLNRAMGLNLTADNIAALETRTEGWIAGLQLAALSMQGRSDTANFIQSFTGSHHFVQDYLVEEVLQSQSETVLTFLLHTSILDRMCGSLCDAVLLDPMISGQDTLEYLERANLFIVPLDDERRWYRYHHLFAELLRQRCHRDRLGQVSTSYIRASDWYEQHGFGSEAINHALHGEDFERAAYLIEQHFADNYEHGDQTTLRRWLAELPIEMLFSRPQLCILHAWNMLTSGQLDAADQSLHAAEKLLDTLADHKTRSLADVEQNQLKLVSRIAAIRSFIASYSGDSARTIQHAHQALEYLPEDDLSWRTAILMALGDAFANTGQMLEAHRARSDALAIAKASGDGYMLTIANLTLAEVLRQQGQLPKVITICTQEYRRASKNGFLEAPLTGWLSGIWGEVLAETDDLDRAIELGRRGVQRTTQGGDLLYAVSSHLCLIRVLFSSGDLYAAQEIIRTIEEHNHPDDLPLGASHQLSAWQGRLWLAQGEIERAVQWIKERELDSPDLASNGELNYLREVEHIVAARVFIAQRRLHEATTLLQRLYAAAEAGGRISRVIEILILQALAHHTGGSPSQALNKLKAALTLAEPGGFVRIFVDEGQPIAHLLNALHVSGVSSNYMRKLLAAFPTSNATNAQPAASPNQSDQLSRREIEILRLISDGLTNPEIAIQLHLTLNTVKTHTRNIYSKLDVSNRTQAVNRARASGLLD